MNHLTSLTRYVTTAISIALATLLTTQEVSQKKTNFELIDAANCEIQLDDTEYEKLLKQRMKAAIGEWRAQREFPWKGHFTYPRYVDVAKSVAESRLEFAPEEKSRLLMQYIAMAKADEKRLQEQFAAGTVRSSDLERAKYFRLDAEIRAYMRGNPAGGQSVANPLRRPRRLEQVEVNSNNPMEDNKATEPEISKLMNQRAESATAEVKLRFKDHSDGMCSLEALIESMHRARHSCLWLAENKNQRCMIDQKHFEFFETYSDGKHAPINRLVPYGRAYFNYERDSAKLDVLWASEPRKGEQRMPADPTETDSMKEPEFVFAPFLDERKAEYQFLLMRMANHALEEASGRLREFKTQETFEYLFPAAQRARDARLKVASGADERLKILSEYLGFARYVEDINRRRYEVGASSAERLYRSQYERLTAEIDLLVAKTKK